jgi:sulfite dehydrogenase (quinone) subunit SoeC
MHPALSVIFFTVASGAGFGMLALLGAAAGLDAQATAPPVLICKFVIGLALTTVGLLASTFHLGRPERAWRAFSQWRSSWLSREGVLSVLTYPAALALAAGWLGFLSTTAMRWAGMATAVLALATLVSTGMIYASLKAIPRWSNRWTLPGYVALGLMSGALLLHAIDRVAAAFAIEAVAVRLTGWIGLLLLFIAVAVKLAYWWSIDHAAPRATIDSATGLVGRGPVRQFESPHTAENYVMQEMGYRIARKHAKKLRRIALALGFIFPALLLLPSLVIPGPIGAALFALLAAVTALIGLFVERWLFFAEARHVVTLFYGAAAV